MTDLRGSCICASYKNTEFASPKQYDAITIPLMHATYNQHRTNKYCYSDFKSNPYGTCCWRYWQPRSLCVLQVKPMDGFSPNLQDVSIIYCTGIELIRFSSNMLVLIVILTFCGCLSQAKAMLTITRSASCLPSWLFFCKNNQCIVLKSL